ncbi:MAG: hypothetical protein JXR96_29410 [Deltaproteobacteria bacterium]|nr:hypothetical protein [Deltaproteobacteria bacterium]
MSAGVRTRDPFWAHAAAFGALWGAVEITLGAFVHAIRLPFAGALLAGAGACILLAQRQIMPRRGLSLATGVVAAACKSISPGGVIFGPMLGILTEAVLIECVLLLSSRAVLSACLAGALAACATLVHHVLKMWLFFGGKIIDLYISAIEGAGRAVGLGARAGWWALVALALIVAAIGAAGGLLGRHLGQRAARRPAALPVVCEVGDEPV